MWTAYQPVAQLKCCPSLQKAHPATHTIPTNSAGKIQLKKGKCSPSPYSITKHRVPELIPVLGSQPAVTPTTLKRAATNFAAW